jgi:hypothetical protein
LSLFKMSLSLLINKLQEKIRPEQDLEKREWHCMVQENLVKVAQLNFFKLAVKKEATLIWVQIWTTRRTL